MATQLKGTLENIPVTQFFHLVRLAKKTGTYRLYQRTTPERKVWTDDPKMRQASLGKEYARITFDKGMLVHATTSGMQSHLISVLYKAGKLSQEQYRTLHEKSGAKGEKALALALINANYITQRDTMQCLRQHMLDIVYDVMRCKQEVFTFQEGELAPTDAITVWIDLENIIAENSRRMREIDELMRAIPSLDLVLKFPKLQAGSAPKIQLKQDEWHVLSRVNATSTIGEIAVLCHMTEIEIRRIVRTLMRAGLVEPVTPITPEVPAPAATAAASKSRTDKGFLQRIATRTQEIILKPASNEVM